MTHTHTHPPANRGTSNALCMKCSSSRAYTHTHAHTQTHTHTRTHAQTHTYTHICLRRESVIHVIHGMRRIKRSLLQNIFPFYWALLQKRCTILRSLLIVVWCAVARISRLLKIVHLFSQFSSRAYLHTHTLYTHTHSHTKHTRTDTRIRAHMSETRKLRCIPENVLSTGQFRHSENTGSSALSSSICSRCYNMSAHRFSCVCMCVCAHICV